MGDKSIEQKRSEERREKADQDAALRQAQMSYQIKESATDKKRKEGQNGNQNSGTN